KPHGSRSRANSASDAISIHRPPPTTHQQQSTQPQYRHARRLGDVLEIGTDKGTPAAAGGWVPTAVPLLAVGDVAAECRIAGIAAIEEAIPATGDHHVKSVGRAFGEGDGVVEVHIPESVEKRACRTRQDGFAGD